MEAGNVGSKVATPQMCGRKEQSQVNCVHSEWTESARWKVGRVHAMLLIMQGVCRSSRVGKQPQH